MVLSMNVDALFSSPVRSSQGLQRDERHRVRLPLTEEAEALHDVHALYLRLCGIESFDLLYSFTRALRSSRPEAPGSQ